MDSCKHIPCTASVTTTTGHSTVPSFTLPSTVTASLQLWPLATLICFVSLWFHHLENATRMESYTRKPSGIWLFSLSIIPQDLLKLLPVSIVYPFWLIRNSLWYTTNHTLFIHSPAEGSFQVFDDYEESCYKYSCVDFCVTSAWL